MFMEDVVAKIWQSVSREYLSSYKEAAELKPEQLFENLSEDMNKINFTELRDEWFIMTNLPVIGCMHCIKKGRFSGCSFCDYYSHTASNLARVTALKDKRPELYAKLISLSFKMSRGKDSEPAIVEYVSGHDTLSPEIMTEEVYEEIDNMGEFFKSKALYTFFETRASNITVDRLKKWKAHIGDKVSKRIVVEFGVESGNEWIRNHWINKNITDLEIQDAITKTHEVGLYTATSIIIGIPGLNDAHSAEVFKQSFLKLFDMGSDFIICIPLVRKGKTLQDYLYDNLKENQVLEDMGIVKGEHTGMPWLVTVLESVCDILRVKPGAEKRMVLGPVYFRPYLREMSQKDFVGQEKQMADSIVDALEEFGRAKDRKTLLDFHTKISKGEVYQNYLKILKQQVESFSIKQVMKATAEELAKSLWPNDWEEKNHCFEKEIEEFDYAE